MKRQRKTKIVATVTPAALDNQNLIPLIEDGVDVFRFNFSHGTHEEFRKLFQAIDNYRQNKDRPVAVLQDLAGPEVRLGRFETGGAVLEDGQEFLLSTDQELLGDNTQVAVNHPSLPEEVKIGDRVILDDGRLELEVLSADSGAVKCRVSQGGAILDGRGLAVPGRHLSLPALTEKDKQDATFGLELGVDFIALSFVRTAEDVQALDDYITRQSEARPGLIAKIETQEAVDNFEAILEVADGIMIARGDLAIEVSPERVPLIQKDLIKKSNRAGKPVITATQMLESMVKSPVATRAEVSDVANAVLDGTDALMLSAETAIGEHPLKAFRVMAETAYQVERNYPETSRIGRAESEDMVVVDAITYSVTKVARDVEAELIITLTDSGFTPRMVSRHKPRSLVVALATNQSVCNRLALTYGCWPVFVEKFQTLDRAFSVTREFVLKSQLAQKGDRLVVSAGLPFGEGVVKTNSLFVEVV